MIPEVTKQLVKTMGEQELSHELRIEGLTIEVRPRVFAPSPYSASSRAVYEQLQNVQGSVLDLGTGTGILALYAAQHGADMVDACDILPEAVSCARYNVERNGLEHKITVFQSDLFGSVPERSYDLIVANLPILSCKPEEPWMVALCDDGFALHERLFAQARDYLSGNRGILLCHADLEGKKSFERLEELAGSHGYRPAVHTSVYDIGHEWRTYEFR